MKSHEVVILCERGVCAREGSAGATLSNLIPVLKSRLRSIKSCSSKSCSSVLAAGCVLLLVSAFAFAENLTGTVKNGTNDKAAAGDDVPAVPFGGRCRRHVLRRLRLSPEVA